MDFGLKNKRALVMGGSSGIGLGIAKTLAGEGARVALCARGLERLEKAAAGLPAAVAVSCDLSKPGAGATCLQEAARKLGGGVDILVTNAGGPPRGDFQDITPEQWQAGFQGLFLSVVESVRAALPGMIERKWGRVLLVTSVSVREPLPALTISNSIRPGLAGLANSLSRETARHGVTVNVLMPGYTATERLMELRVPLDKLAENVPARRLGRPEEIGALAAFLASDQAAYITGQAIAVDGGFVRAI